MFTVPEKIDIRDTYNLIGRPNEDGKIGIYWEPKTHPFHASKTIINQGKLKKTFYESYKQMIDDV
jgi:hypothetical protein